jgi:hypothetical protein
MCVYGTSRYTADLHAANKAGAAPASLEWKLEYSFKSQFGMADMSVGSFEALAGQLATPSAAAAVGGDASSAAEDTWNRYRGSGDGCLYVGGYTSAAAPFPPKDGIGPCNGTCRSSFVADLNATNLG